MMYAAVTHNKTATENTSAALSSRIPQNSERAYQSIPSCATLQSTLSSASENTAGGVPKSNLGVALESTLDAAPSNVIIQGQLTDSSMLKSEGN